MKVLKRSLAVCLAVLFMAPAAHAQNHVIGKAALDQAVQNRVSREVADRDAIVSLLRTRQVRDVADQAGLSLTSAEAAVSTLGGADLEQIAAQARRVNNDISGGASTIVISTTTIIIVLLLVILLVAVAD